MKLKGHVDNVKSIVINPEGTQVSHLFFFFAVILNLHVDVFSDFKMKDKNFQTFFHYFYSCMILSCCKTLCYFLLYTRTGLLAQIK